MPSRADSSLGATYLSLREATVWQGDTAALAELSLELTLGESIAILGPQRLWKKHPPQGSSPANSVRQRGRERAASSLANASEILIPSDGESGS